MKIKEIYNKFQIPKNLQDHMLQVGALAKILTESWIGEKIDKKPIVHAALLHDIAKPVNFDLAKQAKFGLSPEDIKKLEELQNELKTKYGNTEHEIVVKLVKDIGCSEVASRIVGNVEWSYIPNLIEINDIESLITNYADMRISMFGILPLEERLDELKSRSPNENIVEHLKNGKALEKVLFKNFSINPNSVTNEQINLLFEELSNLEI